MPDLVDHIRADSVLLADAAEGSPRASIVRYPGWSQLDLLVHTGSVHRRTLDVVRSRSLERMGRVFPPDEQWATVAPWFREGAALMADVLEHTDPRTPVWAFGPDQSVGAWRMRMALETAVHRWDAQRAAGEPAPLDATLAERGIGEFGVLWASSVPIDGLDSALALRATDTGRSWVLTVVDGRVRLGAGDADQAVSAGASELYLWLLGRLPLDRLMADGDPSPWERAIRALPDASR